MKPPETQVQGKGGWGEGVEENGCQKKEIACFFSVAWSLGAAHPLGPDGEVEMKPPAILLRCVHSGGWKS